MEKENLLKMKKIDENLKFITENITNLSEPIFIELIGTPKSGKTTLFNALKNMFEDRNVEFQGRQETAEYNPIKNKDIEEYNIWMIAEIIKNLSEDMANKEPRIVVYDRGILDRIPWIDYAMLDNSLSRCDGKIINSIFDSDFISEYKPLAYSFLTSPEISVKRKGKEERLVNKRNVGIFNKYLLQENSLMASYSKRYYFAETDSYQGRIKDFIIDMSEAVTQDVSERIKEELDYYKNFKNIEYEKARE